MSSHADNVAAYRAMLIGRAVAARKIAPDRADDYRCLFDADPKSITHLLTAPVEDGGLMAGNAASVAPLPPVPTEYPRQWLAANKPTGGATFEDGARPAPRADRPAVARVPGVTIEP